MNYSYRKLLQCPLVYQNNVPIDPLALEYSVPNYGCCGVQLNPSSSDPLSSNPTESRALVSELNCEIRLHPKDDAYRSRAMGSLKASTGNIRIFKDLPKETVHTDRIRRYGGMVHCGHVFYVIYSPDAIGGEIDAATPLTGQWHMIFVPINRRHTVNPVRRGWRFVIKVAIYMEKTDPAFSQYEPIYNNAIIAHNSVDRLKCQLLKKNLIFKNSQE